MKEDLDAVLVAVGGASRGRALLFSEDDGMLVKENISDPCTFSSRPAAHRQFSVTHQLTSLGHGHLKPHKTRAVNNSCL